MDSEALDGPGEAAGNRLSPQEILGRVGQVQHSRNSIRDSQNSIWEFSNFIRESQNSILDLPQIPIMEFSNFIPEFPNSIPRVPKFHSGFSGNSIPECPNFHPRIPKFYPRIPKIPTPEFHPRIPKFPSQNSPKSESIPSEFQAIPVIFSRGKNPKNSGFKERKFPPKPKEFRDLWEKKKLGNFSGKSLKKLGISKGVLGIYEGKKKSWNFIGK